MEIKTTNPEMKKSVFTLMNECIVEKQIDLNSKFKLERVCLINAICDKIDWSGYNPFSAERKVRVIEKMVQMAFDKK